MGSLAQYCTHAMRRSIKHGSNISVEGYMIVGTKKNVEASFDHVPNPPDVKAGFVFLADIDRRQGKPKM